MLSYRDLEEKRAMRRATLRETMVSNNEQRKFDKLCRKMEHFETYDLDGEGLKLKDFKKVDVPKITPQQLQPKAQKKPEP